MALVQTAQPNTVVHQLCSKSGPNYIPTMKTRSTPYVGKQNAVGKIFISIFCGGVNDVIASNWCN